METPPVRQDPATGVSRPVVEEQLERVLKSSYFRRSQGCLKLLDYVVKRALDNQNDVLHERSLGVAVFGRSPYYDPSDDPVVRVRAGEVRKRLAQYYADSSHQGELRIDLPTGSYIPEFVCPSVPRRDSGSPGFGDESSPRSAFPVGKRTRRIAVAGTLAVLAAGAIGLSLLHRRAQPAMEQFWGPIRRTSRPVMLTLGHAPVYALSSRAYREYFKTHPPPGGDGPLSIQPDPAFAVRGDDMIPMQGHFVGAGGAQAVLRYAALLGAMGKSCNLRTGLDFSYSDLRNHPSILLGAFSSRWASLLTRNLRFRFEKSDAGSGIRDTWNPGRVWMVADQSHVQNVNDYAMVARISPSETGELLIIAAGITHHGTASAAEFLTDAAIFSRAMAGAPRDWRSKNLQIVIRTKVVEGVPGPPEVMAMHFW